MRIFSLQYISLTQSGKYLQCPITKLSEYFLVNSRITSGDSTTVTFFLLNFRSNLGFKHSCSSELSLCLFLSRRFELESRAGKNNIKNNKTQLRLNMRKFFLCPLKEKEKTCLLSEDENPEVIPWTQNRKKRNSSPVRRILSSLGYYEGLLLLRLHTLQ